MPDIPNRSDLQQNVEDGLNVEFNKYKERVLKLVSQLQVPTSAAFAAIPRQLWDELYQDLLELLTLWLTDAFIDAHGSYSTDVEMRYEMAFVIERAKTWARESAPALAQQLLNTTELNFMEIAWTSPYLPARNEDLRNMLESSWAFSPSRARAIAVTEMTNVIAAAERYINKDMELRGAKVFATWYTKKDERVCVICKPRHGKRKGEEWEQPPPAHVNCRCEVQYEIQWPDGKVSNISALEARALGEL